MDPSFQLFVGGSVALLGGLAVLVYGAFAQQTTTVSGLGRAGLQRQRARENEFFALVEPLLRIVAVWVSLLPLGELRTHLATLVRRSGDTLGLTADEAIALSVLTGLCGATFAWVAIPYPGIIIVAAMMAAMAPYAMLHGRAAQRAVDIARALPGAMQLVTLCVSAGMDLPGALREVLGPDSRKDSVLEQEFRELLRDLDLGHSRRRAVEALDNRVEGEGVKDFCASIIQSEQTGNPLKEVLQAQAGVLQMRRSMRAEVAASQASVKMVIPMSLLMLAVLIIISAPLMIKFQNGVQ